MATGRISQIHTVAFEGIETRNVLVETQVTAGVPCFQIVGLADKAVVESRERIRACFHALGMPLPSRRITVNLAPADLQKEGSHFDLPIAVALMGSLDVLDPMQIYEYLAIGEIGLDGAINHVSGALAAAMHSNHMNKKLICPYSCGREAAWAGSDDILAAPNLVSLINHFKGTQVLSPPEAMLNRVKESPLDLRDIKGQAMPKRVLEIAAAGGHNVLLIGPPGSGKSMLAQRLPTILPTLSAQESLAVTNIHSLASMLPESGLMTQRPFRDPHHSASLPALVGGGAKAKPGEISLSHHGVLFLDELPEFQRATLEALRQPLETGKITVSRANRHVTYPAQIQLIAAMNPCRCGHLGDVEKQCHKVPVCGEEYQGRISGPLLDRFDLVIYVPALPASDLLKKGGLDGEASAVIRARVEEARDVQMQRYENMETKINAFANGQDLHQKLNLSPDAQDVLEKAITRLKLSGRGYHRILRVARTIADLAQSDDILQTHMAEAIGYRRI